MNISEHTFIVTGGASGLGEASVRALHQRGARVVIADRDTVAGDALAESLGDSVVFRATDVTDEAQGQACVTMACQHFGSLHGLVNCAGISAAEKTFGKRGPHPLETFARTVQVNLLGSFNMARLAAAAMAENSPGTDGERGVIINTASVAAYEGQIGQVAYAASKGGIVAMTLPMARDLASLGIRVMSIAPGLFMTPMLAGLPDEVRQSLGQSVPYPPRLGMPDEYARLMCAIVDNNMLNGETIRLDGALRMAPR
ncbi:MAG: 3-hydroxyacyl-CoA dehydrogenase [Granulosicoccus sp.]|nr:3-hydroxyacyl-CoA dehydrogenase [Granulosicoccus sp.]